MCYPGGHGGADTGGCGAPGYTNNCAMTYTGMGGSQTATGNSNLSPSGYAGGGGGGYFAGGSGGYGGGGGSNYPPSTSSSVSNTIQGGNPIGIGALIITYTCPSGNTTVILRAFEL